MLQQFWLFHVSHFGTSSYWFEVRWGIMYFPARIRAYQYSTQNVMAAGGLFAHATRPLSIKSDKTKPTPNPDDAD